MGERIRIEVPKRQIGQFCEKWRVQELSLFGSVLRGDFRPDSDVDVLVSFAPEVHWGFHHLLEMKGELESLFGRPVDLVEKRLIDESPNYIRRKHILTHLEPIYVAG